eukprot:scaffold348462_cov62-Attheya_sp.AAC.1
MVELSRNNHFVSHFSRSPTTALVYEQMPGFKFHIRCGLHFGGGIEGTIRPNAKIDILGFLNIRMVVVLGSGLAQSVQLVLLCGCGLGFDSWVGSSWGCVLVQYNHIPGLTAIKFVIYDSSSQNYLNFPDRGGEVQLEI